jgi:hypothetical protein
MNTNMVSTNSVWRAPFLISPNQERLTLRHSKSIALIAVEHAVQPPRDRVPGFQAWVARCFDERWLLVSRISIPRAQWPFVWHVAFGVPLPPDRRLLALDELATIPSLATNLPPLIRPHDQQVIVAVVGVLIELLAPAVRELRPGPDPRHSSRVPRF